MQIAIAQSLQLNNTGRKVSAVACGILHPKGPKNILGVRTVVPIYDAKGRDTFRPVRKAIILEIILAILYVAEFPGSCDQNACFGSALVHTPWPGIATPQGALKARQEGGEQAGPTHLLRDCDEVDLLLYNTAVQSLLEFLANGSCAAELSQGQLAENNPLQIRTEGLPSAGSRLVSPCNNEQLSYISPWTKVTAISYVDLPPIFTGCSVIHQRCG